MIDESVAQAKVELGEKARAEAAYYNLYSMRAEPEGSITIIIVTKDAQQSRRMQHYILMARELGQVPHVRSRTSTE